MRLDPHLASSFASQVAHIKNVQSRTAVQQQSRTVTVGYGWILTGKHKKTLKTNLYAARAIIKTIPPIVYVSIS